MGRCSSKMTSNNLFKLCYLLKTKAIHSVKHVPIAKLASQGKESLESSPKEEVQTSTATKTPRNGVLPRSRKFDVRAY